MGWVCRYEQLSGTLTALAVPGGVFRWDLQHAMAESTVRSATLSRVHASMGYHST